MITDAEAFDLEPDVSMVAVNIAHAIWSISEFENLSISFPGDLTNKA